MVLVEASPTRTGLYLYNQDDSVTILVYASETDWGAIWLDPRCWIKLEQEDDADKKWWVKTLAATPGNAYLSIVEFYRETTQPTSWWPF